MQRPLKKGSDYMVPKHVAFAPGNKWGQAPFCKKEDILIQKMGPGPVYIFGKAQDLRDNYD